MSAQLLTPRDGLRGGTLQGNRGIGVHNGNADHNGKRRLQGIAKDALNIKKREAFAVNARGSVLKGLPDGKDQKELGTNSKKCFRKRR